MKKFSCKTCWKIGFSAAASLVIAAVLFLAGGVFGLSDTKAKAADVTVITTQAQLAAMADNLSGNYELGCDIALTGAWTPIGVPTGYTGSSDGWFYMQSGGFSGTFNGKGHKITGLSVNVNAYTAGLFGCVSNATIENVSVSGSVINSHTGNIKDVHSTLECNGFAGGIAGYAYSSTFKNCSSNVSVTGPELGAASEFGGLLGAGYYCTVLNCCATGNVTDQSMTGSDYSTAMSTCGGLVGFMAGTVYNCYAAGTVTYNAYCASCNGTKPIGGLIGQADPISQGGLEVNTSIDNCYTINPGTGIPMVGFYTYYASISSDSTTYTSASDMKTSTFVSLLNTGVSSSSDTGLMTWAADINNVNGGYPYFNTLAAIGAGDIAWQASGIHYASWNGVTGAAGYCVKLYKSGTAGAVKTVTVDANTFEYDFTNDITATGVYTFTVTALGDGSTVWDSPESVASSNYSFIAPLAAPATAAWDTTVPGKAAWSAVPSAAGYTVSLYKSGKTGALDTETVSAATTAYDFTSKITVTGNYTFYVSAIGDGTSTANSAVKASSAYAYTNSLQIAAPSGLAWNAAIPGKATWSAVTDADSYTVKLYKSASTNAMDTETVAAGTTEFDFTGKITTNGKYTFTVTANGNGTTTSDSEESPASAIYTYLTPKTAPTATAWDITVPGKATWSAVTGNSGYIVKLYKSGIADAVDTENAATGATAYDFTGKITSTGEYTFTVITKGNGSTTSNSPESAASGMYAYTAPVPSVLVTEVTLDQAHKSLAVGETAILTAMVSPENATDSNVLWSSSDSGTATVDNTGRITAVRVGTAMITATTEDGGKTAACSITVTAPAGGGDSSSGGSGSTGDSVSGNSSGSDSGSSASGNSGNSTSSGNSGSSASTGSTSSGSSSSSSSSSYITPVDVTVGGNTVAADENAGYAAIVTPSQTNATTVRNDVVKIGNVVVTAPAAVLYSALGSGTRLTITQSAAPASAQTTVQTVVGRINGTVVTVINIDLIRTTSSGVAEAVHNLSGAVTVTIALTDGQMEAISSGEETHVYYYDPGTGELTDMNAVFDKTKGTASFTTTHFSSYVISTVSQAQPAITGVSSNELCTSDKVITFSEGSAILDGRKINSGDTVSAQGRHVLVYTDGKGNKTTTIFVIDKTAPVISVRTEKKKTVRNKGYSAAGVTVEAASLFQMKKTVTFQGKTITWPSDNTFSKDGKYIVTVKDKYGRSSKKAFTIDQTAPQIKIGEAAGGKHVEVTENNLLSETVTLDEKKISWRKDGMYTQKGTYTVTVKDKAGHETTQDFKI